LSAGFRYPFLSYLYYNNTNLLSAFDISLTERHQNKLIEKSKVSFFTHESYILDFVKNLIEMPNPNTDADHFQIDCDQYFDILTLY
jgi:hypothetical protein